MELSSVFPVLSGTLLPHGLTDLRQALLTSVSRWKLRALPNFPRYDRLQREPALRALPRSGRDSSHGAAAVRLRVSFSRPVPVAHGTPGGGRVPGLHRHGRFPHKLSGAHAVLPLPGSTHTHEPHAGQYFSQRPARQRVRDPVQLRGQHPGAMAYRARRLHMVWLR